MRRKRIRKLLDAAPFRSFTIQLEDGRDVHVRRRDLVKLSPRGRTLVVMQPDDQMSILDVSFVTNVLTDN